MQSFVRRDKSDIHRRLRRIIDDFEDLATLCSLPFFAEQFPLLSDLLEYWRHASHGITVHTFCLSCEVIVMSKNEIVPTDRFLEMFGQQQLAEI